MEFERVGQSAITSGLNRHHEWVEPPPRVQRLKRHHERLEFRFTCYIVALGTVALLSELNVITANSLGFDNRHHLPR